MAFWRNEVISITLRWHLTETASCFHAVAALMRQEDLVDGAVASALRPGIERLRTALIEERVPAEVFFNHLLPLAADADSPRELAERVLIKTIGRTETPIRLFRFQELLADLPDAFHGAVHDLDEFLEDRTQPLRQKWETAGPGLLNAIAARTEAEVLVEEARLVPVYPVMGGYGTAFLSFDTVLIEAVSGDPVPEFPEILRLGWLLSMLKLDLPRYSDPLQNPIAVVAALAMLPVALAAGEEVQLVPANDHAIARAVNAWLKPGKRTAAWTDTLNQWWEVYQAMRPAWPAALAALDQLLVDGDET